MRLLNIFLPPIPVFMAGKFVQGLLNILLCFLLWLPAVIHSWSITTQRYEDKRTDRIIKSQKA